MNTAKRQKRHYKRITAQTVAKHRARAIIDGNGTRAVETTDPEYKTPHDRAYRIQKKSESIPTLQYIDDSLQQIGAEAVQELGELIHSRDERIKQKSVHYAIDHIRGKAVQKSVTLSAKLNIQSVLD